MPKPVPELAGHLLHRRLVPAADEHRGDRAHVGAQSSSDAALQAAHVGIGGPHIVVAREQQRDVDRHAREDRLLDGGKALERAGDLDEQVRTVGLGMQFLGCRHGPVRVMGEQRRDLQRHEAIHSGGPPMDRREQFGGLGEVLDGELEEQRLPRLAGTDQAPDLRVVRCAVRDRVVEDRRVRGQARDRQLVDVPLQRAAAQQVAGDVVEPETLPQVMQPFRCLHRRISLVSVSGCRKGRG